MLMVSSTSSSAISHSHYQSATDNDEVKWLTAFQPAATRAQRFFAGSLAK